MMCKILESYQRYFYKNTVINSCFVQKGKLVVLTLQTAQATAGIYRERLPEVGKHAFRLPSAIVDILL